MFTIRQNDGLKDGIHSFFDAMRITAVFSYGVAALVDCKLITGQQLYLGRKVAQRLIAALGA